MSNDRLFVIDVEPLRQGADGAEAASRIRKACSEHGFFYVTGHGIDPALLEALEQQSRAFFALPLEQKMAIRMELGGRAWRGYFPVGQELTAGRPDQKEGLYFGTEDSQAHPKVESGTPLFGRNLFPAAPAGFRETVLTYLDEMTALGHVLMRVVALSLGLEANYFERDLTRDPFVLFRIFHYPSQNGTPTPTGQEPDDELWGVGEHTDYGLLTILRQDDVGGLEVRARGGQPGGPPSGWIAAPPIPGAFVCNIGDMLDRMTAGFYRSTPHRVVNRSTRSRLSFPFFFDPGFDAQVRAIEPGATLIDDAGDRWDSSSVHTFEGTYGDYILTKVRKVFADLGADL